MKYLFLLYFSCMWFNLFAQKPAEVPYASSINRADTKVFPVYKGTDLGCTYTPAATTIKIWAPTMLAMKLHLYSAGLEGSQLAEYNMKKDKNGVWSLLLKGKQEGKFFTLTAFDGTRWTEETTDPYSRAVGANGKRSAIIDLKKTIPAGWAKDKSPGNFSRKCDAVIYELHIRDASIHPNSGVPEALRGKFAGLALDSTKNSQGHATGLSHLKQLGVTHVQLLPFYDFFTVDETQPQKPQYNWGYDPLHYNVPEGSYSTDATNPYTRIKELKQMVQAFHKKGLRVVMDVVYNHTMKGKESNFNLLVPDYYYRTKPDGAFSDASACGNETASDAPMFRKFMLESLEYWVKEYHIDGFRFDLMAIHDQQTMNEISKRLHAIKPDILLHGEGWTAGGSPLAEEKRAVKRLAYQLDRIAMFSDEVRDAMKGGWSDEKDNGFVSGKANMEESIKYGITGAVQHSQIDYTKVNYSKAPFAKEPWQCIVYNECHDNHTLWDRLINSAGSYSEADRKKMYKLAQVIVLTSQGIPFIHAGQEMYRTKRGIDNSYNKPDSINRFDWNRRSENDEMVEFTKLLIQLRKKYPAFRLNNSKDIASRLQFYQQPDKNVISYTITQADGRQLLVILNGNIIPVKATLPAGRWHTELLGADFNTGPNRPLDTEQIELASFSAAVLRLQ
jgi:pullulanase